ncbi:hypothetical protein TARUN_3590 [Trichoderma arundinaceum]|uniref:Zn(2)-C6 fungal-type domain-containing protein n=1 Tax=Trichoderma arundinaceum TaxID=490622 RepID=A0A395NRA0_TRIAR|nr:hypothetical protein TARUN_3590 [Trichoderma arundinaceum]
MKTARYATSRQKACQQCSVAKARCDRKERCCSRCAQRGLPCAYPHFTSVLATTTSKAESGYINLASNANPLQSFSRASGGPLLSPERDELSTQGTQDPATPTNHPGLTDHSSNSGYSPCGAAPAKIQWPNAHHIGAPLLAPALRQPDILEFSELDLICPINAEAISNRWLNAYIPIPGQSVKNYPPTVSAFIYRLLKSYTGMAIHGHGFPPFVHSSQVLGPNPSPPLSTCLSLIRICDKPLPGSENATSEILQREMNALYDRRDTSDDISLLSSFQAFLMYTMVLFFRLSQGTNPFLRQAMMNLQELACVAARRGLMCRAEQQRTRPKWESWIVAEAKRRTLFTMYLFDSVLSSEDGLPTFLGTELEGLPASASRTLWLAQTRRDWETAYNMHLAEWDEGSLCIDELWPIPQGLDQSLVAKRRYRVDSWLENLDEFGTMLYAVTSCTHGG